MYTNFETCNSTRSTFWRLLSYTHLLSHLLVARSSNLPRFSRHRVTQDCWRIGWTLTERKRQVKFCFMFFFFYLGVISGVFFAQLRVISGQVSCSRFFEFIASFANPSPVLRQWETTSCGSVRPSCRFNMPNKSSWHIYWSPWFCLSNVLIRRRNLHLLHRELRSSRSNFRFSVWMSTRRRRAANL